MSYIRAALGVAAFSGVLGLSAEADPGDFIDMFVAPGSGGLDWPASLTFGPDGDLYVLGNNSNSVVRYNGVTGEFVAVFASGAPLVFPMGLTFGSDGDLYVSNWSFVHRYDGGTGSLIDTLESDVLVYAWHLAFGPDGNLYVASYWDDLVVRFDVTTGDLIDVFASGEELVGPTGLTFGPDGNLYVSSAGTDRILRYSGVAGAFIDVFAGGPELAFPTGLRFGPDGDLFVCAAGRGHVLQYCGTTGEFIGVFTSEKLGGLLEDLTFGPDGNLYVANRLLQFYDEGVPRYEGPDCAPDPGCESDCNGNGVADGCDIADGTSQDLDANGIPDECCQPSSPPQAELIGTQVSTKNRFLSIEAGELGRDQVIRVKCISLPPPFDIWDGREFFVGKPFEVCENAGQGGNVPVGQCAPAPGLLRNWYWAAPLVCEGPNGYVTDWATLGVVHVFKEVIVPGGVYEVAVIDPHCSFRAEGHYSAPLMITQARWGDVVKDCTTEPCGPPNGIVNITDVTAVLDKFRNLVGAPRKARCDLAGIPPIDGKVDFLISILDVTWDLDAFIGAQYPFPPPDDPCP